MAALKPARVAPFDLPDDLDDLDGSQGLEAPAATSGAAPASASPSSHALLDDDLDAVFRSIELDERGDDFLVRAAQSPQLDALPEFAISVAPGAVVAVSSPPPAPSDEPASGGSSLESASVITGDGTASTVASWSPAPAPAIDPSAAIFADAPEIPPLALDLGGVDIAGDALTEHAAELLPAAPSPRPSDDLSAPPADDPAAAVDRDAASGDVASVGGDAVVASVGGDAVVASVGGDAVVVSEEIFVAGDAAVEDGAGDDAAVEFETGADDDAEFVFDPGEEVEVEAAPDDRGALLAASVTSRRKDDADHERLFAVDARAEAIARAAMLVEEAEHAASPGLAAELLTLAADIHEGVAGDRARARELVLRARGLAPQLLAPLRALRRLAIAAGDSAAALALCDEELALPLSDTERHETRLLAAELASLTGHDAPRRWDEAAVVGGLPGALARIFSAGLARDRQAMGDALGGLAAETGGVLAASVDVARARLIEASADQSALAVIRDAVRRDPTDTGAWLAIARIGLGRANAGLFREALTGLARAAEGGVGARAADATRVALDAILGDPVAPVPVDGDGAEAWLVAHALRDGLGDPSAQVERSLAGPDGSGRDEWLQWKADAPRGHAARYAALQRAVAQRADAAVASAGAAFLGGDSAGLVEAGLRAQGAAVDPVEADLTGLGSGAAGSVLRAALVATTSGIDAAEAVAVSSGEGPWSAIMRHHAQAHAGQRDEARAAFAALAAEEGASAGAVAFARRAVWLLGGDAADVTASLRAEAAAAVDPRRAAGQRLLASCLAASGGLPDGGDDAVRAAEALPGDLAVAEIAALHAQRGEPIAHAGADLFDAAAAGDGAAPRMAAVRAALRRAASDHDAAAESVWRSWQRQPQDFALGTLVLRSPARGPDRAAAVARALADVAWAAGRDRADAVVGATAFLAAALEPARRFTEAAQAIARARSVALSDTALEAAEERLWLRGGMYAEAAERAFDRLNASGDIDQRLAAYERLVEIDRSYRGQAASAVLSLQEILAVAPGHQPSLHALLRFCSEQGQHEEVAELCRRFVEHAADARDALAFAHLGARLAVALADGDPFAGLSFHQSVRGRALHDPRLLNALDAAARRAGDHPHFAEVQLGLAEAAADGTARAVYLTRAGDAFDAIGDRGRALDCYLRAAAAAPHDLAAHLAVAGLTGAMDDPRGAAEAWESVGAAAVTAEVAVRAWTTAAALWRDRLNERTRCLAALRQALARDPTHREALAAALAIVRDAGDAAGELELLERYAPSESAAPDDALSMHVRAAEIAESQGDLPRAIAQWRAALGLAPESASTLRALARVARAAAEWTVAADAMIRLAKTSTDEAERVELLYGLGEIFESHIPDPRRAEAAWRRVLVLAPRDERTLVKLSALYRRTGDAAREADVTQSLAAALAPSPERTERLLRLAAIAELPLGDLKRAATALEVARRDNPSDLRVLRAFRSFHERNHHPAAALALVDRAIVEVRGATDRDPRDTAAIARLSELLELRGQGDASRIAAAVAVALGSDDDRARSIAGDGAVQGIGAAALTPDAIALLAPPAVELPIRELLERAAPVLEPLVPFDPRALGAAALGADDHPLRADLAAWARMLELGEVEIWVAPDVPAICMPVSRVTPAVVVSAQREATPAGRFAAARAMLLTALSLAIPTRLAVSELTLVIGALLRQFDPMYRPEGVDAGRLVELSAGVTRALSRELHAELRPIAQRILADGVKDAEAIRAGAHELGDRVALLATGDVAGGIALLSAGARRASESVATIDRLLRVALSERFMEARRIAGADRGAER